MVNYIRIIAILFLSISVATFHAQDKRIDLLMVIAKNETEIEKRIEKYSEILDLDENNIEARKERAYDYFISAETIESFLEEGIPTKEKASNYYLLSKNDYLKVVELDSLNYESLFMIGNIYFKLGDKDAACLYFRKGLKYDEKYVGKLLSELCD